MRDWSRALFEEAGCEGEGYRMTSKERNLGKRGQFWGVLSFVIYFENG